MRLPPPPPFSRKIKGLIAFAAVFLVSGCHGGGSSSSTLPTAVTTTVTTPVTTTITNPVTTTVTNPVTTTVAVTALPPPWTFGAAITGGVSIVGSWLTTITVLTNGIDVDYDGVGTNTVLYRAPADFLLDAPGGQIVSTDAGATVAHTYRLFRRMDGSTIYTHYLGSEFAAFTFGHQPQSASPTVLHGGAPAPAVFLSTVAMSAAYVIPAGAAFGSFQLTRLIMFMYNRTAGTLGVDFSGGSANLNLTLAVVTVIVGNVTYGGAYELAGWEMSLSTDKRTFDNYNCPSSGGAAASGCGGEAVIEGPQPFHGSFTVQNNAAAPGGNDMNVFGAFYGSAAQEFAIALHHNAGSSGVYQIDIGILGRKANAGAGGTGASGTSAPAGALAAFPRAEFAAFASADAGGAESITHSGSRTSHPLLATMSAATYRISAGKAGGVYTAANGAEMALANTGAGDALRVDFASGAAVLDLAVGDSTGAHGYVLDDVGLELLADGGFGCGVACTGSVRGSGALSGFNAAAGLEVDGAFYGAGAEEAAAVLRHTAEGGVGMLEMGFVGVR